MFVPVEVGASSDCVVAEILLGLLVAKVFQGVRPQQVAHGPKRWGLFESVQLGHGHTHTPIHTRKHKEAQILTVNVEIKTSETGDEKCCLHATNPSYSDITATEHI